MVLNEKVSTVQFNVILFMVDHSLSVFIKGVAHSQTIMYNETGGI